MMRVLICFDRPSECRLALDAVKAGAPKGTRYTSLEGKKLTSALTDFFKMVETTLDGKPGVSAFDDFDLILLDNNLTDLDIKGARLTAEGVAGYIRAFSTTPYVVSLNKNPRVDFDLEYLIGDFATRADLAIDTDHLENRALWTGNSRDSINGFHPWYWPSLVREPDRRRHQIRFIQANLRKRVLQTFGFSPLAVRALSRHAKGGLSPEGEQPTGKGRRITDTTFLDFFLTSPRTLPTEEDRKRLLRAKNTPVISRAVAGDLDVWFRRDVLGPQDVLVDVPHLLLRMPFLLGNKAADLKTWNAIITKNKPPFGLDRSMYRNYLSRHRFRPTSWAPSPAFWGPSLRESESLNKLFFQSDKARWADVVFCEDTRSFKTRNEGESAPKEFVTEFESPWDRRYVCIVSRRHYVPRTRLAL